MSKEKRVAKRKRKRRIRWIRLLVFTVLVLGCGAYFISGGGLPDLPFLKSFEPQRLFAIDQGEDSVEIAVNGKGIGMYDNGRLTFYDVDGAELWSKPVDVENPRIFANETYIVMADAEQGRLWRLNYEGETVNYLEKDFPLGGIYQNRGDFLVYFGQEGNRLDVIDDKGKTITEITVPKGYILDSAISDSSKIIAVSTLSIENEKYYCSILFYNLDGTVMAGNRYDGEIIFRTFFTDGNELRALSDRGAISMTGDGDLKWEKDFEGTIVRADLSDSGYVSMILEDENGESIYRGIDEDGNFSEDGILGEKAAEVKFNGRHAAVFKERSVEIFDRRGKSEGTIESDFAIEGGGWLGENRIMLSYDNRIEVVDIY